MQLQARTHPARYLMHKYWSRKPHNIVRSYIEHYSQPGDTVLDPFCGSGVTVAEAIRCGRDAVGCDINPMAVWITEHTCRPVDVAALDDAFEALRARVEDRVQALYTMPCDHCRRDATLLRTIWERCYTPINDGCAWFGTRPLLHGEAMEHALATTASRRAAGLRLRDAVLAGQLEARDEPVFACYRCDHCGAKAARPLSAGEQAAWLAREAAVNPTSILPVVPLHATAHQSVTYVHELFTRRNLVALGLLRDAINGLPGDGRDWMRFVFSSCLSQASRLVFVIERRGRYGGAGSGGMSEAEADAQAEVGSWTVPNYWVPPRNYEINAWRCFAQRFAKVRRGKQDWERESLLAPFLGGYHVARHDARDLTGLVAENGVDYVFTDPPYGDAIPYLGVSLMWSTWLDLDGSVDFAREIHLSGGVSRAESTARYREGLARAVGEVYRVLKPERYATFCFNTHDPEVWRALDGALEDEGFLPVERRLVKPARPSAKSRLVPQGSLDGDVLITVRKPA